MFYAAFSSALSLRNSNALQPYLPNPIPDFYNIDPFRQPNHRLPRIHLLLSEQLPGGCIYINGSGFGGVNVQPSGGGADGICLIGREDGFRART